MAQIYMAFADTPGIFASVIRRVIKRKYIHVAIALDEDLEEAYSVGRRHPASPLSAGFEREEKEQILHAFPSADYMVCALECTQEQREYIERRLREDMRYRFSFHYAIIGLPFLLIGKPFYQRGHYTCSSYAARLLEEAGVVSLGKHFSLATPADFLDYEKKRVVFEGSLKELTERARLRRGRAGGERAEGRLELAQTAWNLAVCALREREA